MMLYVKISLPPRGGTNRCSSKPKKPCCVVDIHATTMSSKFCSQGPFAPVFYTSPTTVRSRDILGRPVRTILYAKCIVGCRRPHTS